MSLPEFVGTQMINSSTGADLITAATLTVSFNGGAFAAPTNAPAHVTNGWWRVQLTGAERTNNQVDIQGTHASGITQTRNYIDPVGNHGPVDLNANQNGVTVGSVAGSVGSVVGNVGGNVVGSVGSVTGNVDGNVVGSVGSVVGDTKQTGDNFPRLGAPAGASVSADIADLPTVAEFIVRTLLAAEYFDPAADTVAIVTTVTDGAKEATIGVAGAGLTDLGGMSTGMRAEVESEANDALVANHLDHIYAVDYDPAAPPGVATAWGNELVQDDGQGVTQFTATALANISSVGGGFVNTMYRWSNDITATDPTSGRVKANNATLASITAVYIHSITDTSGNATGIIEALRIGDGLLIAREGSGGDFFQFVVDALAVDNGAWYTITGAVTDSGGTISNNNTVIVTFAFATDDAATIASAVWDKPRAAHVIVGSFGEAWDLLLTRITATLFAGMTSLAEWLGLLAGKQVADATALTELQATGAGSGTYSEVADSQEVLGENGVAILTRLPIRLTRNTAHANFQFLMVQTDGITPATGLTVTGGFTLDATAEVAFAQSITELANGMYRIDLTAAQKDALNVTYRFSGTGARDRVITFVTQP